MKNSLLLIKAELLAEAFGFPILTTCKVSRTFINKELVHFIIRILAETKELDDKIRMLIKLKKIILQTSREPDPTQLAADPAEFAYFFNEIKKEQAFYEPVKWINAELDYLKSIKYLADELANNTPVGTNKEWLNGKEVMKKFTISQSKLNRLIAEGMPRHPMGSTAMFNIKELDQWLLKQE